MALSVGLDSAVKALRAHQLAADIASHNMANALTPGFSRQRVNLRAIGPAGSFRSRDALLGQVGLGVDASDVNRVRDVLMDVQVRQSLSSSAEHRALASALSQTELRFGEPSDNGLASLMGNFWGTWHDVGNDPESSAARITALHAASTMAGRFQTIQQGLTAQRADLDRRVTAIGNQVNAATQEIAQLNLQIKQTELNGDMANDLRDRRDFLLDELSGLVPISYQEDGDSSVRVYLDNRELVSDAIATKVLAVADPSNPGMMHLVHEQDGTAVAVNGGELAGVYEARDVGIPDLLTKLDALAAGFIAEVNAVHTTGFGLDGTTGVDFFTGINASDIALNAVLDGSPASLAAAATLGATGDGSIALQIADLQLAQTMALGTESFDDFYANLVSGLGADVQGAQGLAESGELFVSHLEGLRQSVSGVNLDEELMNLNNAQHAYEAAARVITVIDEMLDTLINRTGR